ncbi:MAG TPA: ATP-binding protein [Desulfosalsimonadaceae bacterium]|nr:ATP-binding protein [Desulfosalsimonadaceae bacterium]
MKELTIISGKGGTGKTSLTAAFAGLAQNKITVDADVDAADMDLILTPSVRYEEDFKGGHYAVIRQDLCTECGECRERCQYGAISEDFVIDKIDCEGCGVCVYFCPAEAIEFPQRTCGRWYISDTRHGTLVHAKLGIAEENSGLLVSLLRQKAKEIAEQEGLERIIVDGPPGIGCPVIASVTNSNGVLVITEPTLSGIHDMQRVQELAEFLNVPTMLCINKYDLNPGMAEKMQQYAQNRQIKYVGAVPYDRDMTKSMVEQKTLLEYSDGKAATAVRQIWDSVAETVFP